MNQPLLRAGPVFVTDRRRRSHGVTLIELVLTMAVAAMLIGGLTLAIRLSTQSLNSATALSLDTNAAVEQLNAEARLALAFSEQTATALTFSVPDRTGDGAPDTIRYAWAGAGSPLTRTVNGLPSPAAVMIENVQSLNFTFLTRAMQPPVIESGSQILSSYTATNNAVGPINKTAWEGESFRPTLPANAISWKITAAEIKARKTASSGTITVSIYAIDATNKPSGSALSSAVINVSSLPSSYGWVSVTLPPVSIATTVGAAIVISSTNSTAQSEVTGVLPVSPATVGMWYVPTTTQGASWAAPVTNTALNFKITGTITTQGPLP